MFDVGASELLVIAIVALLVIGPKDLPRAMRTAGQWAGKMRAMTKHFRSGIDAMIREADLEDQEKEWAERNASIMKDHPADPEAVMTGPADGPVELPDPDVEPRPADTGAPSIQADQPAPDESAAPESPPADPDEPDSRP